jgi:sulfite exporter TauE/SafE
MDLLAALTAALALGAAGSLHCFVMCGPLACAVQRDRGTALVYHLARIGGYGAVGGVLGALGGVLDALGGVLALRMRATLPWLLALVLLAAVIDPGGRRLRRLPALPGIAQLLRLITAARAKLSPIFRAALMGAVTPLLPCGLVYGIAAAATASASAVEGALIMSAFACAAVPALLVAQLSSDWLKGLPRVPSALVQRGLPLLAAVVLVYRAVINGVQHACH